jgi:hypothetical protein
MTWERPDFVEIGMNAEIGGYQSDFGDSDLPGPRKPTLMSGEKPDTGEKAIPRAPRAS